ncbi:MAG: DNA mismatch repair endonuclease MutL [Parachlamydiales bacterium]|nr:DNA mismatch repair endonuclease MutL [Parachlamydiales bacterium]
MAKVFVLDSLTINQIAAGEVVENSSSVIKELVDNSIDAHASTITIEIVGGGKQLIRVIDDGLGMCQDDAVLCLERHATSKIRQTDDLMVLQTMGFRGEALPSIAAISKLTLMTAQQKDQGTLIRVEGGKLVHSAFVAKSIGTTIEVADLFYNVPARRKFQKSIAFDTAEIVKTINLQALANSHISFHCYAGQKKLLSVNAQKETDVMKRMGGRIKDVLGESFYNQLSHFEHDENGLKIFGYVGLPEAHRQNRSGQFLFINKRPVTCPLISFAIMDAYGTLLPPRRHPVFVLNIELPTDLVDANVHPQKKEVRLRHEKEMRLQITRALEKRLGKNSVTISCQSNVWNSLKPSFFKDKRMSDWHYMKPEAQDTNVYQINPTEDFVANECITNDGNDIEPNNQTVESLFTTPQVLGLYSTFLLVDGLHFPSCSQEGLILIDSIAARRKILYHDLVNGENNKEWGIQNLLIPLNLQLTPQEDHLIDLHLDEIQKQGISMRSLGKGSYIVDALPQPFLKRNIENLIRSFIADLSDQRDPWKKECKNQVSYALCKAAVAHKIPTHEEAIIIMQQLCHLGDLNYCPMGKRIWIKLSNEELQKKFTHA